MCTAFFAVDAHPSLLFLLVFNRDEFFDRHTAPAAFWTPDAPHVLAGRDLRRGGTWLGVTRGGRFALLTNYRERNPNAVADAPSRGDLPTAFLKGTAAPIDYLASIDPASHNGFNLVVGDLVAAQVAYLTNRGPAEGGRRGPRVLAPGVYGLSNATLDPPYWAKVDRGVAAVTDLLASPAFDDGRVPWGGLFDAVLGDTTRAPASALPATGVPPAIEHRLSATFVEPVDLFANGVTYGTRSQTGVAVWRDGRALLRERSAAAAAAACCPVAADEGGGEATESECGAWIVVEHAFRVKGLEGGGGAGESAASAKPSPAAAATRRDGPPPPPRPSEASLVVDEAGACEGGGDDGSEAGLVRL